MIVERLMIDYPTKEVKRNNVHEVSVESPSALPADIRHHSLIFNQDFINFVKNLENSEKKGFKNGKWFPYKSYEGGNPSIGYGHKIQDSNELKSYSNGISDDGIEKLLRRDLESSRKNVHDYIKNTYGIDLRLTDLQEEMLTEFAFNLGGLNKFPKFVDAVLRNKWDIAKNEYKRYGGKNNNKKELIRRNQLFFDRYFNKKLSENITTVIKQLILEGVKEQAMEDFIRQTIKGTPWEGKVFVAGGYVRDEFMGKDPKDLDLLVNAPNGGIEFAKWITKKVGAFRGGKTEDDPGSNPVIFSRFGTAKFNLRDVVHNGVDLSDMDIEAVMPRKEQYTTGSRKPTVTGGELKDDVERRDFTVNSLLKDLSTGEILDLTGMGKVDIKAGIIRTPLDPNKIFTDDPLRMLRAIRFAVKYDWKLPLFMIRGIRNNSHQLKNISQERIRDELNKMLLTANPRKAIKMLKLTGLLQFVIPELVPAIKMTQNVHHEEDVFNHILSVLSKTQPILVQRLMALFHDIGKIVTRSVTPTGIHFYGHEEAGAEMANQIMRRLKYPLDLIQAVTTGIKNHMRLKSGGDDSVKLSDKALRKFKFDLGKHLEDTLDVINADNISHSDASSMPNQIEKIRQRLKALDIKTDKPKLPIDGKDLLGMGVPEGKMIGEILKAVTELWLENPNITKDQALEVARQMIGGNQPLKEVYKGGIPR